jgi:polyferredoxin
MKKVRYIVQGFFVALIIVLAIKHVIYRGTSMKTPPLDSYCPFGAIETAYLYMTSGTFLTRVGYSNFIMLFGLILMGVVLKSGFCGWICPLGAIQEWIGKLGERLFGGGRLVPVSLDKYGRYLKYILFAFIIAGTIATGRMVFRNYDPFIALLHLGIWELPWTAYFVLFVVLAGSLFVMRFWCRYFCPLAVIVGFIGKFSIFKIDIAEDKCISCKKCEKLCPMDVDILKLKRVGTVECNSCLACLEAKDIKGAIALRSNKNRRKLIPAFYPVILMVILLGTIYTSKSLGIWLPGKGPGRGMINKSSNYTTIRQRESLNHGKGISDNGQDGSFMYLQEMGRIQADTLKSPTSLNKKQETGDLSREKKNAGDELKGDERVIKVEGKEIIIRGFYTFLQIEKQTGVPADYLISKLKLPSNISRNTNLGNLRKRYGFQMQDVRKHIREYIEKK